MPAITVYPRNLTTSHSRPSNPSPLPQLLQTPSGLALVELQGTFQTAPDESADHDSANHDPASPTASASAPRPADRDRADRADGDEELGTLSYDPDLPEPRFELLVGEHQRLTGTVQKLVRPLAILARDEDGDGNGNGDGDGSDVVSGEGQEGEGEGEGGYGASGREALRVVEIVRHKVVFAGRPEPVGAEVGGGVEGDGGRLQGGTGVSAG